MLILMSEIHIPNNIMLLSRGIGLLQAHITQNTLIFEQ